VHPAEPPMLPMLPMPDAYPFGYLRCPFVVGVHLDPRSLLRHERLGGHFRRQPGREKRRGHDSDGLADDAAAAGRPNVEAGVTMSIQDNPSAGRRAGRAVERFSSRRVRPRGRPGTATRHGVDRPAAAPRRPRMGGIG
jgi:hypothetical protein